MLNPAFLAFVLVTPLSTPPDTKREAVTETIHGVSFVDEYRWLESLESESPEVKSWTDKQNAHTRAVLEALPCHAPLVEELGTLMSLPSIGTPTARGGLLFNTERHGDQNHSILYVRKRGGPKRVLIDPNTLDKGGLISLDWWRPSQDGSLLSFGISRAGDEMSDLHVLRTDTGEWTETAIRGKVSFAGWAPSGRAFLYSQLDDPKDPYSRSVRWHEIGRDARHDSVLVRQHEPGRIPFGRLSRNGKWITLGVSNGWGINDLWAVNVAAWEASGEIKRTPIAVGESAKFSAQAIIDDTLYVLTTLDAPNGRIVAMDLDHPAVWREVVPERSDAVLKGASRAAGMFVLSYQKDATSQFERIRPNGTPVGPIALPGLGSAGISTEPDAHTAFLSYTSYNEPRTVYELDLRTGARSVWAKPDVPVDPSNIVVERLWATSIDGTKVPMFIIHAKDVQAGVNGPHPTMLYAYGGFNISLTPRFFATNFPWYDAGGVYVVANLRGGSEYGETWHRDGMLANKQNVFDDLYACAETLIGAGWTDPTHLAVMGGSNGGLLTGVAATQRPELWNAVVSSVPLLDMLRYDQFLMAKFWVPEYGSSEDPEQFQWLRAYSPYHNIKEGQQYPAMLIVAGENDSRVHPLHARKFTARMQWATRNHYHGPAILLRVDRDAGHGQGKPLSMRIKAIADTWAFVMAHTGLCESSSP